MSEVDSIQVPVEMEVDVAYIYTRVYIYTYITIYPCIYITIEYIDIWIGYKGHLWLKPCLFVCLLVCLFVCLLSPSFCWQLFG